MEAGPGAGIAWREQRSCSVWPRGRDPECCDEEMTTVWVRTVVKQRSHGSCMIWRM